MLELQIYVDQQLQITSCCQGFGEFHGMSCEQIQGLCYDEVLPRLFHKERDAIGWVLETGDALVMEKVPLGKNFPIQVADLLIEPLLEQGIQFGARVIVRAGEIKDQAPLTRPIQRSDELEKLAIMLSHGVRNPLNAIKGAVTYLQSRFGHDPEMGEFTGIMIEEILHLERFISGFLATSCLDQSAVSLDINTLFKKISVYTALQLRSAGVSMSLECGQVRPLQANSFQIEQAILNLLNNAIAVLPPGGQICLSSGMEERQGQEYVSLAVADNGPGMPADKLVALNNPAMEPERGRERGFGLYITREVVQAYGGTIEIDSEPGKGTSVRLLFPVADEGASV